LKRKQFFLFFNGIILVPKKKNILMSFRKISHTTIIILFASFIFFVAKADIFDDIALALKTGNSKELAKYFRPRVELKVGSNEDIYSKAQAEMILKDFFEKNPLPISQLNTEVLQPKDFHI
jgi:hypothetical protein